MIKKIESTRFNRVGQICHYMYEDEEIYLILSSKESVQNTYTICHHCLVLQVFENSMLRPGSTCSIYENMNLPWSNNTSYPRIL